MLTLVAQRVLLNIVCEIRGFKGKVIVVCVRVQVSGGVARVVVG